MLYQERDLPCHVTIKFYHIWNTMLISIKLCAHWANRWWSRWDTTDAAVESVHSGEFPLHYNVDSFCASEIVVSASIARVWQMLCSEYLLYHGNYWQTDWPSTLRYRITPKDSTDTFIEQVQFTDSQFFWKGSQKLWIVCQYMQMGQSDKTFSPHFEWQIPSPPWPSTHPFSDMASPLAYLLLCIRHDRCMSA
jgi:hypothetical protein